MPKIGVTHHDDGSVTVVYPDSRTKDGTASKWLKAECHRVLFQDYNVVKELPLKPNRRNAVNEAWRIYPDGSFAVIVTTAIEIAGLDPDDPDVRRKMCGLVREMEELRRA